MKNDDTENSVASHGSSALAGLSDDDWLQIDMAARGCIGGTSDEWPALRHAIEVATGRPFVIRKTAAWMQGFCEALMIGRCRCLECGKVKADSEMMIRQPYCRECY